MAFVSSLESTADGSQLPAGELHTVHESKPLLVRYDLDRVRDAVQPDDISRRSPDLWRYTELLPLRDESNRVSLGEGMTPLLPCPRLGAELGAPNLYIKDEAQLPTGSFKARGMAMAVSMAKELGVTAVAVPTAGNAGGALAAYAARAGMSCHVFMPKDTPLVNQYEVLWHGAKAYLVDGLIHDCGALVRAGTEHKGWFDMSTLREPYRIEGKKTMGLELAEQLSWQLPDVILYPTGGGTGLIGMWKAFAELAELGWLRSKRRPRMIACQSDGCDPIVRAFDAGLEHSPDFDNPHTLAAGLRVPRAFGDFLILAAVRESGGRALAAPEDRLKHWMRRAMELEGIALCPESAACVGALATALEKGHVDPDEQAVIFNTGAAQKYVEVLAADVPCLDPGCIDWSAI
ncbi:MAG: threonine synthase [Planctomycetota bacterium]|jgi:threonine synthase